MANETVARFDGSSGPDIHIELPVSRRADGDWGCGYSTPTGTATQSYRSVYVDSADWVHAWDEIAESYTRHHGLTTEQIAEAQRLAGLVRAGTHYSAGGFIREIARAS